MPLAEAAPKSGPSGPISVQSKDDVYEAFIMPEHASVHIIGSWRKRLLGNLGKELLSLSWYFLISFKVISLSLSGNSLHIIRKGISFRISWLLKQFY